MLLVPARISYCAEDLLCLTFDFSVCLFDSDYPHIKYSPFQILEFMFLSFLDQKDTLIPLFEPSQCSSPDLTPICLPFRPIFLEAFLFFKLPS